MTQIRCMVCDELNPETWGRVSIGRFNRVVCKNCYEENPQEFNRKIKLLMEKAGIANVSDDVYLHEREEEIEPNVIYHYPKIKRGIC